MVVDWGRKKKRRRKRRKKRGSDRQQEIDHAVISSKGLWLGEVRDVMKTDLYF